MPKRLMLREVSAEEKGSIERLAKSRTEAVRLVQRARIIWVLLQEPNLSATEAGLRAGVSQATGPKWVKRFNEQGVAGLEDEPRPGRPATHDESVRSKLINLALQKPRTLGHAFSLWTLARLQAAFAEQEGIHLSDSTIWEWVEAEGLRWKRQQSWFREAEKHDPEFVEKRGPSSEPTLHPLNACG
jgi:transposase